MSAYPAPGFLIFNASSGKDATLSVKDVLAQLPIGTQCHEFSSGENLTSLTKQAIANGAAWVAVAGGDGTVEAVARALVHTHVPLGIITYGTYNNFSRSADIPNDPLEAASLIGKNEPRSVDVGFVNGRMFLECVGIGIDAAIFPESEKIKSGKIASWFSLLKKAFEYQRQTFDIKLDRPFSDALIREETPTRTAKFWLKKFKTNQRVRLRALMITVSNGPYYGMNFAVAPTARIDDNFLTLSIFKKHRKLELAWHFWSLWTGRKVYTPRIIRLNATKIQISGPSTTEVHVDGTPLDEWPLDISLHSKALRIFAPERLQSSRTEKLQ